MDKMRTVFVFGNPLVEKDSIAVKIAEQLKHQLPEIKFEFVENFDQIGIEENDLQELIILDAVEGLVGVKVFSGADIKNFAKFKRVSAHDIDLAMDLMLWEKIGKLDEIKLKIIAVPTTMLEEIALKKVREVIASLL